MPPETNTTSDASQPVVSPAVEAPAPAAEPVTPAETPPAPVEATPTTQTT